MYPDLVRPKQNHLLLCLVYILFPSLYLSSCLPYKFAIKNYLTGETILPVTKSSTGHTAFGVSMCDTIRVISVQTVI